MQQIFKLHRMLQKVDVASNFLQLENLLIAEGILHAQLTINLAFNDFARGLYILVLAVDCKKKNDVK